MDLEKYPLDKETNLGLLTRLQEECAEVISICAKIKRFGCCNFHPNDLLKMTNHSLLMGELNDVDMIVSELIERGFLIREDSHL